jgi:hypothetical protein
LSDRPTTLHLPGSPGPIATSTSTRQASISKTRALKVLNNLLDSGCCFWGYSATQNTYICCGTRTQASESDSSKPAPSFFSIFSISADSRISPQSRHSTYWASLSFAISWVRRCRQVGVVIVASISDANPSIAPALFWMASKAAVSSTALYTEDTPGKHSRIDKDGDCYYLSCWLAHLNEAT